MTKDTSLEDAANQLELRGQAADFLRRIELERADAARKALEDAAKKIEQQEGGFTYRKANKATAALLRRLKGML